MKKFSLHLATLPSLQRAFICSPTSF